MYVSLSIYEIVNLETKAKRITSSDSVVAHLHILILSSDSFEFVIFHRSFGVDRTFS